MRALGASDCAPTLQRMIVLPLQAAFVVPRAHAEQDTNVSAEEERKLS